MLEQCFLLQHLIIETVALQIRETDMMGLALPAPVDYRKCWILLGNKQRMIQRDSSKCFLCKITSLSSCIIAQYCSSHLTELGSVPVKKSTGR